MEGHSTAAYYSSPQQTRFISQYHIVLVHTKRECRCCLAQFFPGTPDGLVITVHPFDVLYGVYGMRSAFHPHHLQEQQQQQAASASGPS